MSELSLESIPAEEPLLNRLDSLLLRAANLGIAQKPDGIPYAVRAVNSYKRTALPFGLVAKFRDDLSPGKEIRSRDLPLLRRWKHLLACSRESESA